MSIRLAMIALALAAPATGRSGPPARAVPITLTGEDEVDPCPSVGEVRGLKATGDGFLSVRAGPDTRSAELFRLHNGDQVYICNERPGWYGVIRQRFDTDQCGGDLFARPSKAHPYRGPCPSGWVSDRWVTLVAG